MKQTNLPCRVFINHMNWQKTKNCSNIQHLKKATQSIWCLCNTVVCLWHFHGIHEYGTIEETLEPLKSCQKSTRMNCWETFYIQLFHQHGTLINEQVYDVNPLYSIADASRIPLHTLELKCHEDIITESDCISNEKI